MLAFALVLACGDDADPSSTVCGGTLPTIGQGSFERADTSATWPSQFGQWFGDFRTTSAAQQGINPYEGGQMLQFLGTVPGGGSAESNASEVRQAIDVSSCRDTTMFASVRVNRVEGDGNTPRRFSLYLRAYEGNLSDLPSKFKDEDDEIAVASEQVTLTSSGWTEISTSLELDSELYSSSVDYVVFEVLVNEETNLASDEFAGHFADAAEISF